MKYYIDYRTSSGDISHIWVNAVDEEDAASQTIDSYWDVDAILTIRRDRNETY